MGREEKIELLNGFFQENPKAALGFSGGVDSAYLLYAGCRAGAKIQPFFVKTPFQPEFELEDGKRLAKELGVSLQVVEFDVLKVEQAASNPPDRCYYCKKALFGALREAAGREGYSLLLDGTNASDDAGDRPGMRAIKELFVRSPLRECGLTKAAIREASREAGLFTWNKPAYACLATRIPAGERITAEKLRKIEEGEKALAQMGFSDFRIRLFQGAARIQLPPDEMEMAVARRKEIREALEGNFLAVLLDLKER